MTSLCFVTVFVSCTLNKIISKYWVMIFHVLRKWLTKETINICQRSLSYIIQVENIFDTSTDHIKLLIFFYLSFNLLFRYWCQRLRSYRGHDCKQHMVLWWYTQVPNIVWLCQRTTWDPCATLLTWEIMLKWLSLCWLREEKKHFSI